MARKVTRHDMKHDEFASSVGRIILWAEENMMTVVWAVMGVLVTVALGYGVWAWREHRQIQGLLDLIANSGGATAEAAARVHGAMVLPPATAIQLIPKS